jgi:transposase-like protein
MKSLPYPQYRLKEIWKEGKALVWDEIQVVHKDYLKWLIENSILSELEALIGCGKYERNTDRKDYRNGYYERLVATTLGEISINYPRLRKGSFQSQFINRYSRRRREVDYAVLSCFVLGGSTRKTSKISKFFIGLNISHSTVSRIFKHLDDKAREFHYRKIEKKYRFLILDGLWIHEQDRYRKKKVILFVMGITHEGKKEILDFLLADGETEQAYSILLGHLIERGLDLNSIELVIHDGAKGLQAAMDICMPYTLKQYCIFHKIQRIASRLEHEHNKEQIMRDAGDIYKKAGSKREAVINLKSFIRKWLPREHKAVNCFVKDFDKTTTYFEFPRSLWPMISTSNRMERCLTEIRRRTRPMGYFKNDRSVNRIIYSLVYLLNEGKVPDQFTQHS